MVIDEKNQAFHLAAEELDVFIGALNTVILLAFTFISIGVTSYNLGPLTVLITPLLATFKTILVLTYFMHLKFYVKMFGILVAAVLALIAVVIFITFLDYLFR